MSYPGGWPHYGLETLAGSEGRSSSIALRKEAWRIPAPNPPDAPVTSANRSGTSTIHSSLGGGSCIGYNLSMEFGLAGEDVSLGFIVIRQPILHLHTHVARNEAGATGSADPRPAGVVYEDAQSSAASSTVASAGTDTGASES